MTRQQLLEAIKQERETLDTLVALLDEAQLIAAHGGWAVKDHLSHIAAWERMIIAHLRDGSDHEVADMDATSYAVATLDELNDRLYRLHRDHPLAGVRGEFAAAHRAIVSYIEEMAEERLSAVYWDDDPSGRTVLEKISGDTYLHYREHAGWIQELIERRTEAR
ncbi:MAG: ClbS/DfsB family four-helix bundle protein [Dehalococcoidia bacterium]